MNRTRTQLVRMIEPLLPASAIVFVALLFAAAALGKAEQFNQFAPVLSAIWPGGLSAEWASRGTYIVTGCESALAAALLAGGWKSRPVLALTAATLLVFALALVRLWLIPNRPSCGCLGLFGALGAKDGHPVWGLARNAALLWMLGFAWTRTPPPKADPSCATTAPKWQARSANGFSLVELLVVIFVLGILIGLALPMLRGARESGRNAQSASGLRQTMTSLTSYAGDEKDAWPYIQTPGQFGAPIVVRGVQVSLSYFGAGRVFWANVLFPEYMNDPSFLLFGSLEEMHDRNIREGLDPNTIHSRISLTENAFARPEWFTGDEPPSDSRLFAPTRQCDVAFPSRKGVLLDNARIVRPEVGPLPVSMMASRADGSVGFAPMHGADDRFVVPRWLFGVRHSPVDSTRDGWRGIDFGM